MSSTTNEEMTPLDEATVVEFAEADADKIIEAVRSSEGPICWLTGNAYSPLLRDLGHAEQVWQGTYDDADLWGMYVEHLENLVAAGDVAMFSADGGMYGVDVQRYRYVENETHNLADEWEALQ